ncbi:MAG: Uma2 family endonuclease [Candidatus Riflebacteria bacterium]|nr:Uma2 family endonuclease [Candidatus Riflebacteria bacterium]
MAARAPVFPNPLVLVPDLPPRVERPSAKRRLYERHGVREYWVVDPEERLVFVARRSAAGTYGGTDIHDAEGLALEVAAFPGLTIQFDEVFPPRPPVVRQYPAVYRP